MNKPLNYVEVKIPTELPVTSMANTHFSPSQTFLQTTKILPPVEKNFGTSFVTTDGQGKRDSSGKPRYDLIPPEFLKALAIHYAEGAKKYDPRNWERGMAWGECIRALESHLTEWRMGNDFDIDPKMPNYSAHHLIAVAWNAIALYIYQTRAIGTDDRCIHKKEE